MRCWIEGHDGAGEIAVPAWVLDLWRPFLLALVLVCGFSRPAAAQTLTEHLDNAIASLAAGRALLPPPGPVYTGLTDHSIKPKPAPLALGPAGFAFTDPTFGTPMWRVTDATTSGGSGIHLPSSEHATAFNSNGTVLHVLNTGGGSSFFSWNGTTVTKLPYTLSSTVEPQFSFDHPDLMYGTTGRVIKTFVPSTGQSAIQLDLDSHYSNLPLANTYVGGILLADHDQWASHFGGAGIDQHVFVHHSGLGGLLDIRGIGWFIHAISLERYGRYVFVYPANDPNTGRRPGCDAVGQGPNCVAQVFIWDTTQHTLTPMTTIPAGHGAHGYRSFVNQDCCTTSPWDALQWQKRDIAAPTVTADLIPSPLTPQQVYVADHPNWRAARADASVPFITCSYRHGDGLNQTWYPWRAWDQECFAVSTTGNGVVWRFLHHQSITTGFWDQPIPATTPNGCAFAFTSNWGGTVGAGRQDVFLAKVC